MLCFSNCIILYTILQICWCQICSCHV